MALWSAKYTKLKRGASREALLWAVADPDNSREARAPPRIPAHVLAAAALPELHRDPFDRSTIAQAQLEGLTFVTRDAENHNYRCTFCVHDAAWVRRVLR